MEETKNWKLMSNFRICLTSRGRTALDAAMCLAFGEDKARAWVVDETKGLILLTSGRLNGGNSLSRGDFPFAMDHLGASDFATRWLKEAEYPKEPDHDGDNVKGWTLYNETWGHVGEWREAICAVRPTWAMIGK